MSEAIERAPTAPGVVQMRANGIFAYTRGQSAMVYYTCSGNMEPMREFMIRCSHEFLTHAETHGARLIRFGETEQPDRELARLLRDFERRFGTGPIANAAFEPPERAI